MAHGRLHWLRHRTARISKSWLTSPRRAWPRNDSAKRAPPRDPPYSFSLPSRQVTQIDNVAILEQPSTRTSYASHICNVITLLSIDNGMPARSFWQIQTRLIIALPVINISLLADLISRAATLTDQSMMELKAQFQQRPPSYDTCMGQTRRWIVTKEIPAVSSYRGVAPNLTSRIWDGTARIVET